MVVLLPENKPDAQKGALKKKWELDSNPRYVPGYVYITLHILSTLITPVCFYKTQLTFPWCKILFLQ